MRVASVRSDPTPADARREDGEVRWYRYPVAWLGMLILLASLAGVVALIAIAARYPDDSGRAYGERILKTPVAQPAGSEPTGGADRPARSGG